LRSGKSIFFWLLISGFLPGIPGGASGSSFGHQEGRLAPTHRWPAATKPVAGHGLTP
jgi:hypothetical protein